MTPKPISEIQRVVDTVDKFRGVHAGNENTYLFRLKDALDSISSALCVMNMKIEGKTIELQPQPVATLCEAAEALMLFVDQHCNYHDLDPLLADCRRALTAEDKRQELVTNCINAYERLLKEITRDECRHPNADSFNGCYLCNAVGNAKTAKHRLDAHDKGAENG